MKLMNKNLVVINAWYIDEEGKTQKLSFDTHGNYQYKDYLGYQYFGLESYISNSTTPPNWRYRIHPIDLDTAKEHGERSQRAIIFSNITGLKPKRFKSEPKYVLDDYASLRKTGFFDHVSVWADDYGQIYYLLEPYSLSNDWQQLFNSIGFEAIEIHRPIAPYQGGGPGSSSRSFLAHRISVKRNSLQKQQIQNIQLSLNNFFELLNNDPDSYVDAILEMEALDE